MSARDGQAAVRAWFPTLIYAQRLQARGLQALNRELLDECYRIRDHDVNGQAWSEGNYPLGYTSYGSLDQLHRFSSTFDALRERIDGHVAAFAKALDWDLRGGRLQMTDCWANIMPRGCAHSFHIHPQAVVSGTYYVQTPKDCSGLKFEDPRLSKLMAAPPRRARAAEAHRAHIVYPAKAGNVVLFESWLRHEVPASAVDEDRVSISFNYHWI
ncbi:MAG: TIGR02466 family protein [Nevskiales bacterium]|nr:TIGR02466 family protein [Nevskiales bacterium]